MRWIFGCVLAGLIAIATALVWVCFSTYHPAAIEQERVVSIKATAPLRPGQQIKVLSWNVQFMAGNQDNHFFFDGGTDPWPSLQTVTEVTQQVAAVIRAEDPDVILLQELDEAAKRTHYQDQLQELLRLLPDQYASHVSSYYWKADYVPIPEIKGAVGMKLSIISKYPIAAATRYALPAITTDNLILRQFNVKRAVLAAELPIEGGGKLTVFNTHLSAFAQGTDTMTRQVSLVDELLSEIAEQGGLALMGGDFNLIPSMTAYSRLSERNRKYYDSTATEIAPLLAKYSAVPSLQEADGVEHARWYTHMANYIPSKVPDKTIDYIFYTDGLGLGEHYVRSADTLPVSDHLPVVAFFSIRGLVPEEGEHVIP